MLLDSPHAIMSLSKPHRAARAAERESTSNKRASSSPMTGLFVAHTLAGHQSMATQNGTIVDNVTPVVLTNTESERVSVAFNGTYAGVVVNFEISTNGGTNWDAVSAYRVTKGGAITTGAFTLATNDSKQFLFFDIPLNSQFRVRPSAYTSGTASVEISSNRQPAGVNAQRDGGTLHRNAITAADKLASPGTLTVTAVTESGSTLANVAYNVAVAAYNRWGDTLVTTGGPITPSASQAVRIAFAAVTGADGYDIFLSTDAAPKWIGRITETQRQAGGIFSAVGVYSAGGAVNSIDIGIPGTGQQTTAASFTSNNAYTPASVTPVSCAGWSLAHIQIKLALTDLRSAPSFAWLPFFQSQVSNSDWFMGALQSLSLLGATGQALCQDYYLQVDGATALACLIDAISGQGAAASMWVEKAA